MVVLTDDRMGAITKHWERRSVASGGYSAPNRRLHVSVAAVMRRSRRSSAQACSSALHPCSTTWLRPFPVVSNSRTCSSIFQIHNFFDAGRRVRIYSTSGVR